MAFTPIETQEALDAIIGERVKRAKDSVRKEFEGFLSPEQVDKQTADLTTQLSGLKSQIETLTEEKGTLEAQIKEKDGELAKHAIAAVKANVAREAGLSFEAVEFLQGEDEEAIKKSAEALKGLVGAAKAPLFNPEPSGSGGDPKEAALKQMLNEMRGD